MKKVCTNCKQEKYLEDYYNSKKSSDGKRSRCKECTKELNKQYYINNRDTIINNVRDYTLENHDYKIEYKRNWNKVNKDYITEYNKSYRQTENGKLQHKKDDARRRRDLKFIELFINPFPEEVEVDYHHINNILVIPIPRFIHQSLHRGQNVEEHRNLCNEWIKDNYGLDIETLLKKENKNSECNENKDLQ